MSDRAPLKKSNLPAHFALRAHSHSVSQSQPLLLEIGISRRRPLRAETKLTAVNKTEAHILDESQTCDSTVQVCLLDWLNVLRQIGSKLLRYQQPVQACRL